MFIEHRQTFIGHGARLEIPAIETEEGQWMPAVVNEIGVCKKKWNELFETKDGAVAVAVRSTPNE